MLEKTMILDPALETPYEVVDDPSAKTWDQHIQEQMDAYQKAQKRKAAKARRAQEKRGAKKVTGS